MKQPLTFTVDITDPKSLARAGKIITPHGIIETPCFVTVGTKATVKALTPLQIESIGAQVLLANTYHLHIDPGEEVVAKGGGLAAFSSWQKSNGNYWPTMTDSGGFQVFSLGEAFGGQVSKVATGEITTASQDVRRQKERRAIIDDEGVTFRSHKDGRQLRFTPEESMRIQHLLGADIFFAFDECTSPTASKEYQEEALERTFRWAKQCITYHETSSQREKQGLFGVVQGGRNTELRERSAREIGSLNFSGFGIGGSFNKDDIGATVAATNRLLDPARPRHLLGIGEPADIVAGVAAGCDTFDCVQPTRIARNGMVYGKYMERINLHNAKYRQDFTPLCDTCDCYTCQHFTRAYLAHLFRSKEMLAATLASIHNLRRIITFTDFIRGRVQDEQFSGEYQAEISEFDKT